MLLIQSIHIINSSTHNDTVDMIVRLLIMVVMVVIGLMMTMTLILVLIQIVLMYIHQVIHQSGWYSHYDYDKDPITIIVN